MYLLYVCSNSDAHDKFPVKNNKVYYLLLLYLSVSCWGHQYKINIGLRSPQVILMWTSSNVTTFYRSKLICLWSDMASFIPRD